MTDSAITERDILATFDHIRNWGRWGPDDERGTLNLLSAENRRRGVAAVGAGISVGCALALDTKPSLVNPSPAHVQVIMAGDVAPDVGFGQARDFIGVAPHGPVTTHLDALCHVFFDGKMYNGRPAATMKSTGAEAGSVTVAADGIVSRGVLLDIPRLRDVAFVEPAEPVRRVELEEAEAGAGLTLEAGDVALVRLGRHVRRQTLGDGAERPDGSICMAGLHPDCLVWMHERGIALLGSDAAHDVLPHPFPVRSPIHVGALVYMGLHLLDNAQFDDLADACRERGSAEFLFVLAPLVIDGGTASPVNPIAVL